jgi:hypothetical protein
MSKWNDKPGSEVAPGIPGGEGPDETAPPPVLPREEKKRRKVSLIAAIVVNVVTVLTVAIILLAVLMPGYRRSFTMARAVEGSDDVWIVVRTSESMMRQNSTDFIRAQDGLRNALQELVVSGGDNVHAYVRDNFPDQAWIEQNLPDNMQQWLQQLYPKPEESQGDGQDGTTTPPEEQQTSGGTQVQTTGQ